MKQIVVISGKGGTGKTSIVSALAGLGPEKVLADCDVDAADLHLILHPSVVEAEPLAEILQILIQINVLAACSAWMPVNSMPLSSMEKPALS